MTRDRWLTLCKNATVCDLWCFKDLEEKDCSLNESVNDRGVCRKALATPGLLKRTFTSLRFNTTLQ